VIRSACALALVAAVGTVAAGCGGSQEDQPPRGETLLFGEFLDARPDACGLRERPPSTAALDDASTVAAQVEAVAGIVEKLRGLEASRPLDPTFVRQQQLQARLRELVRVELAERDLEATERALVVLGAIPPDYDLEAAIDALVKTAGGVYDAHRKQILVGRTGRARLNGADLEVLAHELEHALSDQRLGLPEGEESDRWGDTHLAGAALAEGSATITELRFLAAQAGVSFLDLVLRAPAGDVFAFPDLPFVIEQSFVFPYLEGVGFVCALYARGGWKAVNRAYDRPPRSSAEILFPGRYLRGERPKRPHAPTRLPAPWKQARFGGVFGAADLWWLFRAPGDEEQRAVDRPLARAGAWAGGRIEIWSRGAESAVAIALVQRQGAPSLCSSLALWYARAFPAARKTGAAPRITFRGERQAAIVTCRAGEVRIGIAPSVVLARRLAR
jgi:hypothetical protein